jgi:hypothetical protein
MMSCVVDPHGLLLVLVGIVIGIVAALGAVVIVLRRVRDAE